MPARPLALLLLTVVTGCDDVEPSIDGLSQATYNPCGPDVDPQDCPGGLPGGEAPLGEGIFLGVTGTRGTHELGVQPLGCSLRMDSVGTAVESDLCPDCALVLEMSHVGVDDACGVGTVAYLSTVGVVATETGELAVYISIDDSDWYALGAGVVDADGVLRYDAASLYDYAYGGYAAAPAYAFAGEHTLLRD